MTLELLARSRSPYMGLIILCSTRICHPLGQECTASTGWCLMSPSGASNLTRIPGLMILILRSSDLLESPKYRLRQSFALPLGMTLGGTVLTGTFSRSKESEERPSLCSCVRTHRNPAREKWQRWFLTQVSHPYQPPEITAKSMPRFLENGRALVWTSSIQFKPRDGKIRFSSASNAFSSCTCVVGGNGCRPSFSKFSRPSVVASGGGTSLDIPTIEGNEGCET